MQGTTAGMCINQTDVYVTDSDITAAAEKILMESSNNNFDEPRTSIVKVALVTMRLIGQSISKYIKNFCMCASLSVLI